MNDFFIYNNVTSLVELNEPSILLINEFAKLVSPARNKCEEDKLGTKCLLAFKEFTYIFLALNWKSPYADYLELERHIEALRDSGLTENEFNNPEFRAACRKYRELLESNRSIKMLQAARNTVDKFVNYFNNLDPEERDEQTGKPIYKVKDVMAEISNLHKVHEELLILEGQVKKELAEATTIRGDAKEGFLPNDF